VEQETLSVLWVRVFYYEVYAMKRLALLFTAAFAVSSVHDLHADNKFNVGGHSHKAGAVRFKLNGGAGKNPRFEIGGINRHHGDRWNNANWGKDWNEKWHDAGFASNSFPVAVGYGGGGWCGYFGDGGFTNLYNQGFIPVPPYFSLHPPVYYSVPVPRTYGYSPFAYPGTVPTPDVQLGPEEIVNPYVEPDQDQTEAQDASTKTAGNAQPVPLVVQNPFVEQRDVKLSAATIDDVR
jgi:hypothetical protein